MGLTNNNEYCGSKKLLVPFRVRLSHKFSSENYLLVVATIYSI